MKIKDFAIKLRQTSAPQAKIFGVFWGFKPPKTPSQRAAGAKFLGGILGFKPPKTPLSAPQARNFWGVFEI